MALGGPIGKPTRALALPKKELVEQVVNSPRGTVPAPRRSRSALLFLRHLAHLSRRLTPFSTDATPPVHHIPHVRRVSLTYACAVPVHAFSLAKLRRHMCQFGDFRFMDHPPSPGQLPRPPSRRQSGITVGGRTNLSPPNSALLCSRFCRLFFLCRRCYTVAISLH